VRHAAARRILPALAVLAAFGAADAPVVVHVTGIVRGPDGAPIAGAQVAFVAPSDDRARVRARSADDGGFSFRDLPAGEYAITATARGLGSAWRAPQRLRSGQRLELRVRPTGFSVSGRVGSVNREPVAGVPLRVAGDGGAGAVFYTETDDAGRYEVRLGPGRSYELALESGVWVSEHALARRAADQTIDLVAARRAPPPERVVGWIRNQAVPLTTVLAGQGFADLRRLRDTIGEARVVALGEAAHGSRESLLLKHRLLEFLVQELGFTTFAIEANWPEVRALDDYVVRGRGNPREALEALRAWSWNTQEILELVQWMRAHNADPDREAKLRLHGFDMQLPTAAARELLAYLGRVDPEHAQRIDRRLRPLAATDAVSAWRQLSQRRRLAVRRDLAALLERFERERDTWSARADERGWVVGRQLATILAQAVELYEADERFDARARSMAANVAWLLTTEAPQARVVLCAHNSQVARESGPGTTPMGRHLADLLGPDYVALGLAFHRGAFEALDASHGRDEGRKPEALAFDATPQEYVESALAQSGFPLFVIDLRRLPRRGPVADWFAAPHPMREIDTVFRGEEATSRPVFLPRRFDGVVFVEQTSRARAVEPEPDRRAEPLDRVALGGPTPSCG
jgi:erythromycin esterase